VSLPCPSLGLKGNIFSIFLHESSGNFKYLAAKSPRLGQCPSSKFFVQNNICMRAVVDSQYGATTVAAESLIAQLHSQGKLTKPSLENQEIQHQIEILKANKHASYV
jgi:hypothetical protein